MMAIQYRYVNDILVIDVPDANGRLVPEDLDDFIKQIVNLKAGKKNIVALNMSMKSYLNSSGLGELIKVKDSLTDSGTELIVINPAPRVESLISMVGVDQFINIISSEDELI